MQFWYPFIFYERILKRMLFCTKCGAYVNKVPAKNEYKMEHTNYVIHSYKCDCGHVIKTKEVFIDKNDDWIDIAAKNLKVFS